MDVLVFCFQHLTEGFAQAQDKMFTNLKTWQFLLGLSIGQLICVTYLNILLNFL